MAGDELSKQARSDAQRLESLKRKKELEKQRQAIIANSLKAVDGQASKKIVFEDSDEDDDTPEQSSSVVAEPTSKKPKLFDDDSDEQEEEFVISNRLGGKKGEKLMKLETRFNDQRFKLDDKFASSESEEEEEHDELGEEKAKNRELLAKVLGKSLATSKHKNKDEGATKTVPRPFTRFDPENAEHVAWMKKYGGGGDKGKEEKEGSSSSSSSEDEAEEEGQSAGTNAASQNFYELDTAFAEELKTKIAAGGDNGGVGFSFLAMMGRDQPVADEMVPIGVEQDIRPSKKMLRILGQTDDFDGEYKTPQKATLSRSVAPVSSKFFLTGTEPHIKSVLANFRMTQSVEKTVGLWSTYRDSIMKIYRHQRKDARKRQRDSKKGVFKSKKQEKEPVEAGKTEVP